MADESENIQTREEQTEVTPQQQGIQFEDILPWGTTGGDTGLSSRLKIKRNFDKIKAWMDTLALNLDLNDKYLSKTKDDEAAGEIGFLKGLWIKAKDTFKFDENGDIIACNIEALGDVIVGELLKAGDIIFEDSLKSKDAISGFLGGRGIWMDAPLGLIQTDGLEVRGFMRVMELIINRLQLMESDYSFTEGDTVDHIDYEDDGQTLVLTMHKDHPNDYTPFYPGDIVYGIVNDLLPRGSEIPDGHKETRNGSYYHTWMRVKSVDLANNKLRVELYCGQTANGTPIVPGGYNFSPEGTEITTDMTGPMYNECAAHDGEGYDTMLALTRHGNVADGIDPDTGMYDEQIHQSQLGRQQAWVLSTTDRRLSFFWNVDSPIIHDENYALCLGMLPELANLPITRNKAMPSLYVNTVFADHYDKANYPARIIKEDRGQWTVQPTSEYRGPYDGIYTPDGTLNAADPDLYGYGAYITAINSYAGSYHTGDTPADPYHCRTFNMNTWLTHRLDTVHYGSLSDKELLLKMLLEWRETVDLEVSRVWKGGKIWECLVDGTTEEPSFGCTDWMVIGGNTLFEGEIATSNGRSFRNGNVDTILTMRVWWGDEDITEKVIASRSHQFTWLRYTDYDTESEEFTQQSEDLTWHPDLIEENKVHIRRGDMGSGWMISYCQTLIRCDVSFFPGEGEDVIMSADYRF